MKDSRAYRQLWRIVDGAVRDALDSHPDYLTKKGRESARNSITKRVTGAVLGYATEVAQGRSGVSPAADMERHAARRPFWAALLHAVRWLRLTTGRSRTNSAEAS